RGGSGVKPLVLPAWSPNLNTFAERFVESAKSECLNRIVPPGEGHLRAAIRAFVLHYHEEAAPRVWATNSLRPRQRRSPQARSRAVRGSAACSSSTTVRPRSPMGRVFAHDGITIGGLLVTYLPLLLVVGGAELLVGLVFAGRRRGRYFDNNLSLASFV